MTRQKLDTSVLAEGEVTGHAHRLPVGTVVYETASGLREFDTQEPVELTHEEHGTVEIPTGRWASGKVREFNHPSESARNVAD